MAKTEPTPAQTDEPSSELIPVCNIDVGEQLIRKDAEDDGIQELAIDIAKHGLLQPIGVMCAKHGRYQLLWGHRRLRAFKSLRKLTIPARVYAAGSQKVKQTALRENVHRLSMTLAEECDVVAQLTEELKLSPDSISSQLGKSRNWVLRRLAIPNMPIDVRDALEHDFISLAAAELISSLEDYNHRAYAITFTQQNRWTQRQVEEYVQTIQQIPDTEDAVQAGVDAAREARAPINVGIQCHGCGDMTPAHEVVVLRMCKGCAGLILDHKVMHKQEGEEGESYGGTDPT